MADGHAQWGDVVVVGAEGGFVRFMQRGMESQGPARSGRPTERGGWGCAAVGYRRPGGVAAGPLPPGAGGGGGRPCHERAPGGAPGWRAGGPRGPRRTPARAGGGRGSRSPGAAAAGPGGVGAPGGCPARPPGARRAAGPPAGPGGCPPPPPPGWWWTWT